MAITTWIVAGNEKGSLAAPFEKVYVAVTTLPFNGARIRQTESRNVANTGDINPSTL
jgi:hypothetical protein